MPPGSLAHDEDLKEDIIAGARAIWDAGFAIGDLHLGNIMLWGEGQGDGRSSVFIDFDCAFADAHASEHEYPTLLALLRRSDSSEQTGERAYVAHRDRSPFDVVPGSVVAKAAR